MSADTGKPSGRNQNASETSDRHSQTRRVLSADPVATKLPRGFHAIERILEGGQLVHHVLETRQAEAVRQ